MNIRYVEHITNEGHLEDLMDLLILCDREFVPHLSARESTTQSDLSPTANETVKPVSYFENIRRQPAFLAMEGGHVIGFMSFKRDYVCEEILPTTCPNIYITTVIVHPGHRHRGITNALYGRLFRRFGWLNVFTRTWSTNTSHIRILSSLKFYEHCRKSDDRGEGIDTVYYYHGPLSRRGWQAIQQYRLTGNLFFLGLLTFFSVAFLLAWAFTEGGILHELAIAFATSLIASALCLLSDTVLKYRESQNDEYINNLKNFGIENLRFHKDELLEQLIPRCRDEIWITGYRLIMTGKHSFREALCTACARTSGMKVRILVVKPWCQTFRLVYGTEDVTNNYIKIFRDLARCVDKYDTQLEIRFTEKPIFNDTYKVDDRFVTGPYLHCRDKNNGRITAKDFFSLDVNDTEKELFKLIEKDYLTVWEESRERLDVRRFLDEVAEKENYETAAQRTQILLRCCTDIPEPIVIDD